MKVFSRPPAGHPDRVAQSLRGFGPVGILTMLLVIVGGGYMVFLGTAVVLLWVWRTRTPWRDLGFVRPRSWVLTILLGIAAGIALKLLMKAIVMPLLGAPPVNARYHYLEGNAAAIPGVLIMIILSAGFGEEIWRTFLFDRFGHLVGRGRAATIATVFITAGLFGLAHYPEQGWMGVAHAFIVGIMVGGLYAATRRIWPLIVLHAAFDICALFLIYWGLEMRVAHLVFH